MKKDVVISIRSFHGYGEDDEDSIDFTTDGVYTYDGRTACFTYLESEVTGMEGTQTKVMVMPDKVVVHRNGPVTSRMVFQQGKRDAFLYDTPAGSATMHMNTQNLDTRFNEHGGHMEIDYVLDMEHVFACKNKFRLTVKEQKRTGEGING